MDGSLDKAGLQGPEPLFEVTVSYWEVNLKN